MKRFSDRQNGFIGFYDLAACKDLDLAETYDVEIVRAELVGSKIHLLLSVWFDDDDNGLLCEDYDVKEPAFMKLVSMLFQSEHGRIASVTTADLICVNGTAKLMKRNGRVCVDWTTFDAEQLPCGDLTEWYQ